MNSMHLYRLSPQERRPFMETFAWLLVAIPLLSYALAVLALWLGIPIGGFIFPIAVCGAFLWVYVEKDIRRDVKWKSIFSAVLVLGVTIVVSACIYDHSCDGQGYHACTIMELVNHWNPMYNTWVSSEVDNLTALWVEHYPRGMETIAATIVACVGSLEAGKALNLWFVIASIVYVYLFLQDYLPARSRYLRVWITLLVALNPVVVTQLFTYYIDWTLYTLLIILLINLYLFFKRGEHGAFYIVVLLLFLVPSIKPNITFWIFLWGVICFFILLGRFRYKRPLRLTAFFVTVALMGFLIGAYNPYLTNWQEHDSPFYPLAGSEKVDIMSSQRLRVIQGTSRVESVLISLVSNPSDNKQKEGLDIFGVSKENLLVSASFDTRIGGFGIFFFESILLAIVLFVCTGRIRRMTGYLWVLGGLFVSLFILPSGWWARYVAFFYLFPFILLFYAERFGLMTRFTRGLHIIILSMLSFDVLISLSSMLVVNVAYREKTDYVLDQMEASGQEVKLSTQNYVFIDMLKRREIPYQIVPVETVKDKLAFSNPLYLNRDEFDLGTGRPGFFSMFDLFQLVWEPNESYRDNSSGN